MGTKARAAGPAPVIGFLDEVDSRRISGWAATTDGGDPVIVHLVVNDREIAAQPATRPRPGVRRRALHPTGACGFLFELSADQALEPGQKVELLAGPARRQLRGSPHLFRPPVVDADESVPRIFFMHVPKTAGSSLNELIARHYPRGQVTLHIESSGFRQRRDFADRYRFMSGHVRAHEMGRRMALDRWFWITLFREPVDHLASHLCWVRYIGEDPQSDFFRNHAAPIRELALRLQDLDFGSAEALTEFFGADHSRVICNLFDNCQTRYLLRRARPGPLDEAAFAEARKMLRRFDLVGTTEHYARFIRLLHARLGWDLPANAQQRLNVQSKRYGLDLNRPDLRAVLEARTRFDRQIYRIANRRLAAQWRSALESGAVHAAAAEPERADDQCCK